MKIINLTKQNNRFQKFLFYLLFKLSKTEISLPPSS